MLLQEEELLAKWVKGGEKVEVEMAFLQCHNAKADGDLNCKATNTVPYKQIHNNIDNESEILNRIMLFRWEDYLTDEKHEEEVEIQKNKRLIAVSYTHLTLPTINWV